MTDDATKPPTKKKRSSRPPAKRAPKKPPPKGRALRWTVSVILGVAAAGALAMAFVYPRTGASHAPVPAEAPHLVTLTLVPNEARTEVAQKLAQAGLIDDPWLFTGYLELQRIVPGAGAHALVRGLSHGELAGRLARKGEPTKVVVPEGLTRFDIAKRLADAEVCDRAAFVAASQNPALLERLRIKADSAEGFLFPATYDLPKDSEPEKLVERFATEFEHRLGFVEKAHPEGRLLLARTLNWGTLEIVALASMVEREAAVAEERPIIASVFLNRLRDPAFGRHLLQSDPTSGYGCVRARELQLPPEATPPSCAEYMGKIVPAMNQGRGQPVLDVLARGPPAGSHREPGGGVTGGGAGAGGDQLLLLRGQGGRSPRVRGDLRRAQEKHRALTLR